MDYTGLNTAYDRYVADKDTAHDLFSLCLSEAHRHLSVHGWGLDRDDIAQEAVMAVFQSLHTMQPDRIFAFWFLAIIRNHLNDAIRAKFARSEATLDFDVSGDEGWQSSYDRIQAAAGANTALVRSLLVDYDLDATAGELGVSKGAVRQRLKRMRAQATKAVANA